MPVVDFWYSKTTLWFTPFVVRSDEEYPLQPPAISKEKQERMRKDKEYISRWFKDWSKRRARKGR